jgi:hypothetical protein
MASAALAEAFTLSLAVMARHFGACFLLEGGSK